MLIIYFVSGVLFSINYTSSVIIFF